MPRPIRRFLRFLVRRPAARAAAARRPAVTPLAGGLGPIAMVLAWVLAVGAIAGDAAATTRYVAACGNDAWAGVGIACVPPLGPKRTIQAAIDDAVDGDEIIVFPGVYPGGLDTQGKAIHIIGTAGADATIIDAEGAGRCLTINTLEGEDTILEGLTFRNGSIGPTEAGGGGVLIALASPQFIECIFEDNETTGIGGGVLAETSSPRFVDCVFRRNRAELAGGGLEARNGGLLRIQGGQFFENEATVGLGGGVRFRDQDAIISASFGSNVASKGGGISCRDGSLFLASAGLQDNTATDGGGGGLDAANMEIELQIVLFRNNHAAGSGGGMRLLGCTGTIDFGTFDLNTVEPGGQGGGLLVLEGDVALGNTDFGENVASVGGGVSAAEGATVRIDGAVFDDNLGALGGAVHAETGATVTVGDSDFVQNIASVTGGACSVHDASSRIDVVGGTMLGNGAGERGGAGFVAGGTLRFVGTQVSGNESARGGAVFVGSQGRAELTNVLGTQNTGLIRGGFASVETSGDLEMINTTVALNTSPQAGAMFVDVDADAAVRNTIFSGNGMDPLVSFGSSDVRYSIVPAGWGGPTNLHDDPVFVNLVGGDYRLAAGSPGIDAGFAWLLPDDVFDVDGDGVTDEVLPLDRNGDPRVAGVVDDACGLPSVDMGAYETAGLPLAAVLRGDFDGDGDVDFLDLLRLLGAWGPAPDCPLIDLDGDGSVDFNDLLILLAHWTG